MLGSDEYEFSGHVHIDLSGALQPPVEPLWRKLMLGAFARRVGRATDRAEGLLEIEHGFLRQTKHGFLDWARNTINFGRLHRLPLSGLQTIRAGRSSEKEYQQGRAGARALAAGGRLPLDVIPETKTNSSHVLRPFASR